MARTPTIGVGRTSKDVAFTPYQRALTRFSDFGGSTGNITSAAPTNTEALLPTAADAGLAPPRPEVFPQGGGGGNGGMASGPTRDLTKDPLGPTELGIAKSLGNVFGILGGPIAGATVGNAVGYNLGKDVSTNPTVAGNANTNASGSMSERAGYLAGLGATPSQAWGAAMQYGLPSFLGGGNQSLEGVPGGYTAANFGFQSTAGFQGLGVNNYMRGTEVPGVPSYDFNGNLSPTGYAADGMGPPSSAAGAGPTGYAADGMGPPSSAANNGQGFTTPDAGRNRSEARDTSPSSGGGGDRGVDGGPGSAPDGGYGGADRGSYFADGGIVGMTAPRYADGGLLGGATMNGVTPAGGSLATMGFASGGSVPLGAGGPGVGQAEVEGKMAMMLKNPQVVQKLQQIVAPAMQSGQLTPQELQMLGQIATACMANPSLYPRLRQFATSNGVTNLPPAYDQRVIITLIAVSKIMGGQQGGQPQPGAPGETPPGQVPPTSQAQMINPAGQPDGGMLQGPGTGRSDSIGTKNMSTGGPVKVSNGEYVIPAHVVKAKGQEFFDNLLRRYADLGNGQGEA